jgi:hypothetical protein
VTSEVIARADQGLSVWCAPETLRATAESLLRGDGPGRMISADALFRRSGAGARAGRPGLGTENGRQLARFHHNQKRSSEAYELLAPVLDRFTEALPRLIFWRRPRSVRNSSHRAHWSRLSRCVLNHEPSRSRGGVHGSLLLVVAIAIWLSACRNILLWSETLHRLESVGHA